MPDFLDQLYRNGGAPRTGAVPGMGGLAAAGGPNAGAVAAQAPRGPAPTPGAPPQQPQQEPPSADVLAELQALLDVQGQGQPGGAVPGGAPGVPAEPPLSLPLDQSLAVPPTPTTLTDPRPGMPVPVPPDPMLGYRRAGLESYDQAFYRKKGHWPHPQDYSDEMWVADQFKRTGEVPTKTQFMMRSLTPIPVDAEPDFTVPEAAPPQAPPPPAVR